MLIATAVLSITLGLAARANGREEQSVCQRDIVKNLIEVDVRSELARRIFERDTDIQIEEGKFMRISLLRQRGGGLGLMFDEFDQAFRNAELIPISFKDMGEQPGVGEDRICRATVVIGEHGQVRIEYGFQLGRLAWELAIADWRERIQPELAAIAETIN